MTDTEKKRSVSRAKILKAMGHPSRIFILEKLARKPHCVCELAEMIGSDVSTVSKHLLVLKNAGLVDDEKDGTLVRYSLRCACVMDFIGCIETVIQINLKRDMALLKRKK